MSSFEPLVLVKRGDGALGRFILLPHLVDATLGTSPYESCTLAASHTSLYYATFYPFSQFCETDTFLPSLRKQPQKRPPVQCKRGGG